MKKITEIKKANNLAELLDIKYGNKETPTRKKFDEETRLFVLSETLKAARKEAHLTQQQLADKIGTKKSYISRIENGGTDIQLSTLFRIFENGLGLHVKLEIG
jgi:HTH-type transcriptional regulator/antitoxin HipB